VDGIQISFHPSFFPSGILSLPGEFCYLCMHAMARMQVILDVVRQFTHIIYPDLHEFRD